MGVNSLPRTVTRRRRGCDLNSGPSAPESSTLTTLLPSYPFSSGCNSFVGLILHSAVLYTGRLTLAFRCRRGQGTVEMKTEQETD